MSRPDQQEISWTMDSIYRGANEFIVARLAEAGFGDVRPAHGTVFETMGDSRSVSEMARLAQMTKQSMAELVRHLVDAGYLRTEPSPSDRRAKVPRLTAKGERCAQVARDAYAEISDRWLERLGPAGTGRLRASLEELDAETRSALAEVDESQRPG